MFVVETAGLQAVVELAEELVEQVALGLVVPVAGCAAGIEEACTHHAHLMTDAAAATGPNKWALIAHFAVLRRAPGPPLVPMSDR